MIEEYLEDTGASLSRPGSRPFGLEPAAQSQPEALIPRAGSPILAFSPPDDTWRFIWGRILPRKIGFVAMVKWRAWGLGIEFWEDYGFGLFIGPVCLAIGRLKPASAIEARQGHDPQGHGAKHESATAEGRDAKGQ